VGGIPADEAAEGGELAGRFLRHRLGVVRGDHLVGGQPLPLSVDPLAQVEVQAEGEVRVVSGVGGGLRRGRPEHHEAGARDDAAFVGLDDAPVHAGAQAEVVGVDDQAPLVGVQGWSLPFVAASRASPMTASGTPETSTSNVTMLATNTFSGGHLASGLGPL
jgi:hypothetical protein